MTADTWLTETYYLWLAEDCFSTPPERREYEGVLRLLHDIPFYWTIWSDENRAGDALSFRQNDFLGYQQDLDRLDQHWLNAWAQQAPSVLEVLLGCARRWCFYFEAPVAFYFQHMFRNMRFDRFPGRTLNSGGQEIVRNRCDIWMARQFESNGEGSPFPVKQDVTDMRLVDIWTQMNAYSAEHFQ